MSNKKGKKNKKSKQKLSPVVESMLDEWETSNDDDSTDILGSYTGNPVDGVHPEQDSDDL
ncbi:MAG: hypothetical protein PUB20_00030 [Clostridia bacterium]|nr:hypothetical protein [Clostridia bacterium]